AICSAVDHYALTGDVAGKLAAEPGDQRSDIARIAETASGDLEGLDELSDFRIVSGAVALSCRGELIVHSGGMKHSWQHVVERDVVAGHSPRHCDGVIDQRRAWRAADETQLERILRGDR